MEVAEDCGNRDVAPPASRESGGEVATPVRAIAGAVGSAISTKKWADSRARAAAGRRSPPRSGDDDPAGPAHASMRMGLRLRVVSETQCGGEAPEPSGSWSHHRSGSISDSCSPASPSPRLKSRTIAIPDRPSGTFGSGW